MLLDAASRAGTPEKAQELAERLGRLPLALRAAGSYLATPTSRYRTFERYRRALDAELGTLLGAAHQDASRPDVARTVVRHTWELSLDQLAAEGHVLARPLLRLLALPTGATAVHGACGTVVQLSGRRDAGSCPACGRRRRVCMTATSVVCRIFRWPGTRFGSCSR